MAQQAGSKFCPNPFNHLNIKQEGKVSACWRYPDKIGNYSLQSLAEIWNGAPLRELRKSLLEGKEPAGCRSCWDLEASGCESTRQTSLKTYSHVNYQKVEAQMAEDGSYPLEEMSSIEVRFDNICNLMCRHCSPDYSSAWEQAVKKDTELLRVMKTYGTYRKNPTHISLTDNIIDEVCERLAPNLKEILIAGGEPLYHEKHYDFLDRLRPYAQQLRLSYNTNLNTLHYQGKSILELWRQFKQIWVRVSLDGSPSCFSYVRVGQNIKKVEANIQTLNSELSNVELSGTCTISLLNITRLIEVIDYVIGLDVYFHASLVQYPNALNIKLLPQEMKKKITQDYNDWLCQDPLHTIKSRSKKVMPDLQLDRVRKYVGQVISYMNSEDRHDQWIEFLNYSGALDRYHKTTLYDVYPEYQNF